MPLATETYSALQSAITDWLARDDLTTAQVTDCITMFEANANRLLRAREQESNTAITTSSGDATLPTDYLAFRSLRYDGNPTREVYYMAPKVFRDMYDTTSTGTPHNFTIQNTTISIRPVDDTVTSTLYYWAKIPALSSTNTTNWLLSAHPDVYLSGCLYMAYRFLRDVDGAAAYKALMEEGLVQIANLSAQSKPAEARPKYAGITP